MTDAEKKARELADTLAKEYGSETFVSDGYGYYYDLVANMTQALRDARKDALEEAAKVAEKRGDALVHPGTKAYRTFAYQIADLCRALAAKERGGE